MLGPIVFRPTKWVSQPHSYPLGLAGCFGEPESGSRRLSAWGRSACTNNRACIALPLVFRERELSVNRACRGAFPPCRPPLGTPRCGQCSRRAKMSCRALPPLSASHGLFVLVFPLLLLILFFSLPICAPIATETSAGICVMMRASPISRTPAAAVCCRVIGLSLAWLRSAPSIVNGALRSLGKLTHSYLRDGRLLCVPC